VDSPVRSRFDRLWAMLAIAAVFFVLSTAAAIAAPPEPTMGLAALQTKLEASPSGTVQGYLKTVLHGSTIETMPLEVLAVTDSGQGALILFEVTGAKIDRIGGIASGMSGSPIYVDNAGVDTLVGAVSYGDMFTKGGTGLATPIEAMMALEVNYPLSVPMRLSSPVQTESGIKDRVILTQDPASFSADAKSGALVAAPLTSVFVGGIDPRSSIFKSYSTRMQSAGLTVVPLESALGTSRDGFTTDFAPGSSVAALATRGDLWVGGIGTVTYTNGSSVLAFGHSAFWGGASSLYLSNAWIDGVWPSTYAPYKMGRPGALRGTITQDRSAGLLGQVGMMTDESPVTAHARNVDTGEVADTAVYVPRAILNTSSEEFAGLAPLASSVAGGRLVDAARFPGSALAKTTVVVNDGTRQHTVTRTNIIDSGYSLVEAVTGDVAEIVGTFQMVNAEGVSHADIVSVNLSSDMTSARRTARVVDIAVPGGLRAGVNVVRVSLLQYGVAATRTVDVRVTIPAGVPLTGTLACAGPNQNTEPSDGESDDPSAPTPSIDPIADRLSVAAVVDLLNAEPVNNLLTVSFTPSLPEAELDRSNGPLPTFSSVNATALVDYAVTGSKTKSATTISASVLARTVTYGRSGLIEGEVTGAEQNGWVDIYGTFAGTSTERLLKTAKLTTDGSTGLFSAVLPALKANVRLRIAYRGDAASLASATSARINVKAYTAFKASRTRIKRGSTIALTAVMTPRSAAGRVIFERYHGHGRWIAISTRTLARGYSRIRYKPPVGTVRVRARYLGGSVVGADTSRMVTLTVRR